MKLDRYDITIDDNGIYDVIRDGIPLTLDENGNVLTTFGGWELVRSIRRYYLAASDWTQIPDAPLSDNDKALWQAYRQALRDIPQVYADYRDVRFPIPPQEA